MLSHNFINALVLYLHYMQTLLERLGRYDYGNITYIILCYRNNKYRYCVVPVEFRVS